jgi:hypothetical protein
MSELQIIESNLRRTARRQRLDRAWQMFWVGFFAGAALWLAALIIYKVAPVPIEILVIGAAVAVLSMAGGFLFGWWR